MKRYGIRLAALGLAAAATFFPNIPAEAAVSSLVENHVLRVFGDTADDSIDITCDAGSAKVNGSDPATGLAACSSLTAMVIRGRDGADTVTLEHVDHTNDFTALSGGEGIFLLGGAGDDVLTGSPGRDFIDGKGGFDTIAGGGESDEIRVGADGATVDGGSGQDFVSVDMGGDNWILTDAELERVEPDPVVLPETSVEIVELWTDEQADGDDWIDGSAFSGTLYLVTYGGDDRLIGGLGNDRMASLGGRDKLVGGPGKDRMRGGSGNDVLRGGEGDDELFGGPGFDRCHGDAGRNRFHGCEVISLAAVAAGRH